MRMSALPTAFSKLIVPVHWREFIPRVVSEKRSAPFWRRRPCPVGSSRNPSFAITPGRATPEEIAVPSGILSDAERARLDSFPAQILTGDIETHFTLSHADRRQVPTTASPANRLGFALQLGALRFLGF